VYIKDLLGYVVIGVWIEMVRLESRRHSGNRAETLVALSETCYSEVMKMHASHLPTSSTMTLGIVDCSKLES
jgi:hypothetical protein